MVDEPNLSRGDEGEWVTYLQQMLEYRQLGGGFTIGIYCDATEQAVRVLQQQSSLEETGLCDESAWAALTADQSAAGDDAVGYETSAEGADAVPGDIAVSIEDEVGAPEVEELVDDLEPLPENATVA